MRRQIKWFIIGVLLLLPAIGHAAGFLEALPCVKSGKCGLDDIAIGFVELIRILLGLMGSVALIYFVWGGIVWMTSGGNMEKVSRGRNIMINTVLALFVSFTSYIVFNFYTDTLLGAKNQTTAGCAQTEEGASCNNSRSYACYQGSCLTKCQIADRQVDEGQEVDGYDLPKDWSLACENIDDLGNLRDTALVLLNRCPGGSNFLCVVRHADGSVVLQSEL